jgi:hypothetical protein
MKIPYRFYFFSERMAIRFHLSKRLLALGWERANKASEAIFTDENLILQDEISKNLEYKHLLANLLNKHCPDIMPITYYLNDENYSKIFSEIIYKHTILKEKYEPLVNIKWILKPSMLNNGDQIQLFNSIDEVKRYYSSANRLGGDHVLQQYIREPDRLDGRKYTFRLHAILTNYAGIFLNRQGYVNISALPFDLNDNFKHKKMHITNYVLDGEFANISQRSTNDLKDFPEQFEKIASIVKACMLALIEEHPSYLRPTKIKRFEIFGFDFIMDADKKMWLLEINQGPDAPTFEDNALNPILWDPFWNTIIGDFVLPVSLGVAPKDHFHTLLQILPPTKVYSRLKSWLGKLT